MIATVSSSKLQNRHALNIASMLHQACKLLLMNCCSLDKACRLQTGAKGQYRLVGYCTKTMLCADSASAMFIKQSSNKSCAIIVHIANDQGSAGGRGQKPKRPHMASGCRYC